MGEKKPEASPVENSDPLGLEDINLSTAEPRDSVVEEESRELTGLSLHGRYIPDKPPHGQWYMNIGYQVTNNLRVGVDYRPRTEEVSVLANWRVFSENDKWRPALILGTSNDDFGTINSQSYYGTLSKYIGSVGEVDMSLYGGGTFIQELDELRPVGGISLRRKQWSAIFMHAGVDEHASISRSFGNHTVTFLMFSLEKPGVAYSIRF